VLVPVGVGPVAGNDIGIEAEGGERLHRIALQIGDEHGSQVAQAALLGDVDELVDEQRPQSDPAPGRIDHPLDPAHQAKRAALPAMERGVGDHVVVAVECQQREDLVVVDRGRPLLDQRAMLDGVPGEAPVLDRKAEEKGVQPFDVVLVERAEQHAAAIT